MKIIHWIYARSIFVPTLFWNVLLGRWLRVRNWWDPIDDHIILGAFPFASDARRLAELGVTGVVNTCEEYAGPQREYEKFKIEQFRMPTVDFTHPKFDDVVRAVEFIEKQVSQGEKTYIHCKAGRARSATVAMCWLIKSRQIDALAAQQLLNQKRPHINQHLPSRPVVQQFASKFLHSQTEPRP